jgi:hypothetical protein
MSDLKALTAMGVQNPEQIARFSIYTTDDADTLRIIYNRKKGSILPVSKKFRFPRLKKSTMIDGGTDKTSVIYESSAEFRNALHELNELMDQKENADEIRKLILDEIHTLEEDVAARVSYIQSLVKKI